MRLGLLWLIVLSLVLYPQSVLAQCTTCEAGCNQSTSREVFSPPWYCTCPSSMDCVSSQICVTCSSGTIIYCYDPNWYICDNVYTATFDQNCGCGGGIG